MRTLIVAVVALSACAGPSKARYVELLHECRVANREHLRMVKEYDKRTEGCVTLHQGEFMQEKLGKLWKKDVTVCPAFAAPEQAWGTVEMGLGGH
jgi:hypothetical protein